MDAIGLTMRRKLIARYLTDQAGAGAAEFAIVVIPFTALILGLLWLGMAYYGNNQLQYAAEAAARCASVQSWSTSCDTAAHIRAYALAQYSGPGAAPTFSYSATGCGHTVTGTATMPIHAVLLNTSINLSASACFP